MTINDWIRDELEKGIAAGIEERWETEVEKRMEAEVAKEVAKNEAKHEEDIYRIAKEMLENKIDVETVASITHLSKDKIMELK